ncbi:MAG: glycosyltransferase family 9 protein [Crocinitomicaceae bacterium]|nr:glycosyltransferase family 9 protein [Crocinitomicaceae bacterium]
MNRILIIQTAFIGDVILATGLLESVKKKYPLAKVDFLLRKGNEGLLKGNPNVNEVIVWDKRSGKYSNLRKIAKEVRESNYDLVINLQRFASSGYITWRSKAKLKVGFDKNPFAFCYDYKVHHVIDGDKHEIERNFDLLKAIDSGFELERPQLYPSNEAFDKVDAIADNKPYLVMAPASVWYTKQLPKEKWMELIRYQDPAFTIYLIGGKGDKTLLDEVIKGSGSEKAINLSGELDLLESAALISAAKMTYVNDSAPLHLASAMDAPVTAFFCSTIPGFGFGPLSTSRRIVETSEKLDCRPCGLHGKKECPKGHFKCGNTIDVTI